MARMVCFFEIKLQNARCDCRMGTAQGNADETKTNLMEKKRRATFLVFNSAYSIVGIAQMFAKTL